MRTRKILTRMGVLVVLLGLAYGGLDLAGAAVPGGVSGDVTVQNTPSNPVPVQQQGTAAVNVSNASVPVHEQGTANVNVTNTSLSVAAPAPITGGAAEGFCADVRTGLCSVGPYTASAIQIVMTSGVSTCALLDGANQSVIVLGPEQGGSSDVEIPLSRPITFDAIKIVGLFGDECSVGMVGDSP